MAFLRRCFIVVVTAVAIATCMHVEAGVTFSIDVDEENFETLEGITHREFIGTTDRNGIRTAQVINLLYGNPVLNPSIGVIVGDDFHDYSFARSNLYNIAANMDLRYDEFTVIGGVTGDFFNMENGIPVGTYIRDGEVVSRGAARPVVGFKDDGGVVFGHPCFLGLRLDVHSPEGNPKYTFELDGVNRLPQGDEITVYFDVDAHVPAGHEKLVLDVDDVKTDGGYRHYAKGVADEITTDAVDLDAKTVVIVHGEGDFSDVEIGDGLLVHNPAACGFEDVRWGVGAGDIIVEEGEVPEHIPSGFAASRHPRTTVGVREDGTILLVTVDGRNILHGREGVTLYELGEIMVEFGAVTAYNLDGGGSTTMLLRDGPFFKYVNMVSDSGPRPISNAVLFVKYHDRPGPDPDDVQVLTTPQSFAIEEGILSWDEVDARSGFVLDGYKEPVYVGMTVFDGDTLSPGRYDLRVKAVGDGELYLDSAYSEPVAHLVHPHHYEHVVSLLHRFARHRQSE